MISHFFIDRPIFASVLSIVIVISGTIALLSLPIAQYPEIAPPTVQVSVSYPGASAQVVADTVAAPIEQQVNGVENMLYMSSTCDITGYYNLMITFALGTDLNTALVAVQNRVNLAIPQLPESVQKQGLTIKKKSPNILLAINFYSPDGRYDDIYLSNYATIHCKDELFRLEGVGDITYLGQRDYSIRAWLDPQALAARGMAVNEVLNAIENQNAPAAPGQIGKPPNAARDLLQPTLDMLGRLTTPEQFGNIVVRTLPAGPDSVSPKFVRLRDVARVELGANKYDQSCSLSGQPSVALAIFQLPGTNALDVSENVHAKMRELKKRFPDGLDYQIVYDTTPFIRDSVMDVVKTLRDAVVLVGIVVLVFLQNWRAALIPLVAVPVAIVGTFAAMAALGFSINNISLFGLVLAIGIVVDDAIVVVENVDRWLEQGLPAREAARRAMTEVTGPVVAVALVLCAVFVPCAFISGITGQFFRQFAITIAVSTVLSAFNSLTLSPALAAILLRPHGHGHGPRQEALPRLGLMLACALLAALLAPPLLATFWHGPGQGLADWLGGPDSERLTLAVRSAAGLVGFVVGWGVALLVNRLLAVFFDLFNAGFNRAADFYAWLVGLSIKLTLVVLLVYGGLLYATSWLFGKVPSGFIPQQDQGWLLVNVQLPDSASVQRTQEVVAQAEKIALATPGVKHTFATAGYSLLLNCFASNFGGMFVILDEFEHRRSPELTGEAIMRRLRQTYRQEVRDGMASVLGPPPINGLGTASGFKVMVEDRGDLGAFELQRETDRMIEKGLKIPGIAALFTQYRAVSPQLFADIDRSKARALGVSIDDVNKALNSYIGSYYVNNFNIFGRFWQVNVMADQSYRDTVDHLRLMKVRNHDGNMAPLSTLIEFRFAPGPSMVMRYNLYRAAPVNGINLPWLVSSGQAITLMDEIARETLPRSMQTEWTELSLLQQIEENDWRNRIVFPLSVVFVFLVLAALYESWSLPLAVILVVPMCLLCSVAGVAIARMDINIFTKIGFVVLVGLASKNAILIVEFARQLQEEGKPLFEATKEACRLRLRPILMTSFAFIFGVVPLVIAAGAGAEMRRALGIAVFSGMLGVTFFGIFLTPVFFYVIQRWGETKLFQSGVMRQVGFVLWVLLTVLTLGVFVWLPMALRLRPTIARPSAPKIGVQPSEPPAPPPPAAG